MKRPEFETATHAGIIDHVRAIEAYADHLESEIERLKEKHKKDLEEAEQRRIVSIRTMSGR